MAAGLLRVPIGGTGTGQRPERGHLGGWIRWGSGGATPTPLAYF